MAKLGFYDIRTIECLSRELEVRKFAYIPLGDPVSSSTIGEKSKQTMLLPEATKAPVQEMRRKKKMREKEEKRQQMLTTQSKPDIRGHTGYLTFAVKF